jgi:uncharacterized membrane protein
MAAILEVNFKVSVAEALPFSSLFASVPVDFFSAQEKFNVNRSNREINFVFLFISGFLIGRTTVCL